MATVAESSGSQTKLDVVPYRPRDAGMPTTVALQMLLLGAVFSYSFGCAESRSGVNSVQSRVKLDVWRETSDSAQRIRLLLRSGSWPADIMQAMISRGDAELIQKLQADFEARPGVALAKILISRPGEMLPYDANMGITQSEYESLRTLFDRMRMQKIREDTVVVSESEDGMLTIQLPTSTPDDGLLKLDPDRLAVETPFGRLEEPTEVQVSADHKLTGAWNGYTWKSATAVSVFSGNRVRLSIGQLTDSRRVIINYDVRDLYDATDLVDVTVYVTAPSRALQ